MATLALQLALFALFFSVKTDTNAQIITVPVEVHTTVELPCSCPICPDSTVAVQWYRGITYSVFRKDDKALASWYGGKTSSSQGFGITDHFSMIIHIVNITDKGLYRCIVTPAGGAAQCTHDVKLGVYAKPSTSPVIEYIQQTNGFNVTCSISNVFPKTFPILTTKEGNGTAHTNRVVTYNSDGTYNTTVTHWFPANEKHTTIECLYSNSDFKSMSSLLIVDDYIIDRPNEGDMMQNNMTHTGTDVRRTTSTLWIVWLIFVIEVILFIVIVYSIKRGRVMSDSALRKTIINNTGDPEENHGENSEKEEPVKSQTILQFCRERSCREATLVIIHTIVCILLAAYIATVSGK